MGINTCYLLLTTYGNTIHKKGQQKYEIRHLKDIEEVVGNVNF